MFDVTGQVTNIGMENVEMTLSTLRSVIPIVF
jgi:hypothetical protein